MTESKSPSPQEKPSNSGEAANGQTGQSSKTEPPTAKVVSTAPTSGPQKQVATAKRGKRKPIVDIESTTEEPTKNALTTFLRSAPAWLISMLTHIALILGLALYTLASLPEEPPELDLIASQSEVEEFQDSADMEMEVIEFEEMVEEIVVEPTAEPISELFAGEAAPVGDISDVVASTSLASLTSDVGLMATEIGGQLGEGVGTGLEHGGAQSAFFSKSKGVQRTVFIVDNSNSMGNGKLETALYELNVAVQAMGPKQFFYIIFYSDVAYGLFHPETAPTMIPATEENKLKVDQWLPKVQMCLRTNAKGAFQKALLMKPQVMYVLGDGAIGDKAPQMLISNPVPGVIIHTLGMKMKPDDARQFELLAKMHRGTYRDVGITEEGKAMLKTLGPRNKNRIFSPPWGLKLPKNEN